MKFFYILLLFSIINFTYSDEPFKLQCYECRSTTKKNMTECEEPIVKGKESKNIKMKNCTQAARGQKPRCFKGIGTIPIAGKIKEYERIVVRDCSSMIGMISMDKKCENVNFEQNLKLKGFNGCVEACDKDLCNHSAKLNQVNFLIQLLLISIIVFGLSNKLVK